MDNDDVSDIVVMDTAIKHPVEMNCYEIELNRLDIHLWGSWIMTIINCQNYTEGYIADNEHLFDTFLWIDLVSRMSNVSIIIWQWVFLKVLVIIILVNIVLHKSFILSILSHPNNNISHICQTTCRFQNVTLNSN